MSNILNSPLSNSKRNKISTKLDLPFYETPTTPPHKRSKRKII
jgi:hypothetical protein